MSTARAMRERRIELSFASAGFFRPRRNRRDWCAVSALRENGLVTTEARMLRTMGAALGIGTLGLLALGVFGASADSLPPTATYRPLPSIPFPNVKAND